MSVYIYVWSNVKESFGILYNKVNKSFVER